MSDAPIYPTEHDERIVRVALMEADTRLKDVQFRTEMWKVAATMGGVIVAAMGAGAGLLAGMLALAKWYAGK